ncbi:MAG: hypothetical protein AUG51_21615 [Acidobacteria bacterium 13_1_20CM_3_53_8]|nr:MAG: hypothetical protein AUG51_21615 [Acidobacteria bacterium 13_1_20CM_3_53_8]
MVDYTAGAARKQIPSEDFADENEIQTLLDAGVIITDERRRRPFYFDGRFLAARDLTNEQNYFLTRQADLGQAGGTGVVHGLTVRRVRGPYIRIEAGSGVTTSGEMVVLYDTITQLDLSNIAEIQRLNNAFGLSRIPNEPFRTRSGIFTLALRPVEFTANPIGSYPTSITGQRTIEDGDIVEASAITLIPYPDEGARSETSMRRSRIARRIFVERGAKRVPAGVLPLALIAIDRGVVQWVDPYMVRREVGAEHGDILGLGYAPRALREAYLLQYEYQLGELMIERAARGVRFAASEYFYSLPPAGRMPAATIDANEFTQIFFPPAMQVDLSIVPEDEVAALLEDSLLLPPIDLTLNDDEMASTSVMALIPVNRERFLELNQKLNNLKRDLRPAAPGMVARRAPLEALRILNPALLAMPTETNPGDDEWRKLLSEVPMLWYIRRRNLSYRAEVTGTYVPTFVDEVKMEKAVRALIKKEGLQSIFTQFEQKTTLRGKADAFALLSQRRFQTKAMLVATLRQFQEELKRVKIIDSAAVWRVAEHFANTGAGTGVTRLERSHPELLRNQEFVKTLMESDQLPEIDRHARNLSEDELHDFARKLKASHRTRGRERKPAAVKEDVKVETPPPAEPPAEEETKKSPEPPEAVEMRPNASDEVRKEKEGGERVAEKRGRRARKRAAKKTERGKK